MKRSLVFLLTTMALLSLFVVACGEAAPPPAPAGQVAGTTPPPAPTTAAVATTGVPGAQPTVAAPAATTAFPNGQAITIIVPYNAGGATDIATRLIASLMEQDLGSPVQVVNRPGAGSQVGVSELATARPDGLTIGITAFPAVITTYLDAERKAVFTRNSFEPIGAFMDNPVVTSVISSSEYQTIQEIVDAAKANPASIRAGTTGILGPSHLGLLQLQQEAGIQLAPVHFDGGNPQMTALLGGHIDIASNIVPEVFSPQKSGQIRPLAIMDTAPSKYLPDVPTYTSQGFNVVSTSPVGISAPAGTPREIVTVLANSLKKATSSSEFVNKMDELGFTTLNPDPAEYATLWSESEARIRPLMDLATKEKAQK